MQFVEKESELKIPKGGLIIIEQKPEDHIMGATSTINEVLRPDGQHDDFLPEVEIQRLVNTSGEDTFMCVSYSANSCAEITHKERYGHEINMDDVFLGVGSGTIRGRGNSVVAPAEWRRKNGFIKEKNRIKTARNMDEIFTPVSAEELTEGQENLKAYEFKYAWLPRPIGSQSSTVETLMEYLKYAPIQASVDGSAYRFNAQGYIGEFINYSHEILIFGYELGKYWKIFDSETEQALKFAWDYPFGFPMIHDIKKKIMFKLVKTADSPAVYLLVTGSGNLYAISDSEEVKGGDVLKTFSGTYKNAGIEIVPFINTSKIVGEIKANKLT